MDRQKDRINNWRIIRRMDTQTDGQTNSQNDFYCGHFKQTGRQTAGQAELRNYYIDASHLRNSEEEERCKVIAHKTFVRVEFLRLRA